ncbi:uncharacterized protein LOC111478340 isoform X1 [Cucurbita maxima]|uniref:Uncharacterized protein LOC111478340 isoform X1 n=1 Tax=Cucurbita maxima TaxID=3661 RepID=A0A6J1IMC9_CUCMA|nr:uncharacterized protein LOC111478340 isoform X1 [Cucurbita maxima]
MALRRSRQLVYAPSLELLQPLLMLPSVSYHPFQVDGLVIFLMMFQNNGACTQTSWQCSTFDLATPCILSIFYHWLPLAILLRYFTQIAVYLFF